MLALANATSSSVFGAEFGPERALAFDPDGPHPPHHPDCSARPFCSAPGQGGALLWWQAEVPTDACVRTIALFGDMRAASDPHFQGIVVELLDGAGAVAWQSCALGATGASAGQHATLSVPGALCCCAAVRVTRPAAARGAVLCLSGVRCFGEPAQSRLLLARHGQAHHNVAAPFCPVAGPGLTEQGQAEAARLATYVLDGLQLRPDIILVSPQRRALETAAIARREPRMASVPVEILRAGYEHAWHEQAGAQIPPADVASWPAGTADIVSTDATLVSLLAAALTPPKGVPNARAGRVAGQLLAPLENAQGARTRAQEILAQLKRRAQARSQAGEAAEPVVLLIAHGGINHDLLGAIDPLSSPFMLAHHQRNGEVKCAALPF